MNIIEPVRLFKKELPNISKPMRYLGGESSSIVKTESNFNIALCFPDLYEIGMSNNAMKILYSGINRIEGVSCERVFSVAADYEQLLRSSSIGLYGLESGLPVVEFDILAFTIGYELAATNVLNVLDICNIPIYEKDRLGNHPIVIAGGPAMTNPVPYANILDAAWVGEAENEFFLVIEQLSIMKRNGSKRNELIEKLTGEKSVWIPGKKAFRNIFVGFSKSESKIKFPAPVIKPIQSHGVVEIMRGCPNGCRFCHAGFFYRPVRYKSPDYIISEVENLITKEGYREISLSSLSSGDYPGIVNLVKILKRKWSVKGVSFQLPSLKIQSFPLELIEEISSIRKGGLTFAVETALETWQNAINKVVSIQKIEQILKEAVNKGYKVAKFYFMIGLFIDHSDISEEEIIIGYINDILRKTPTIRINITLATFVPKPFTPFQWNEQLDPKEASRKIFSIKDAFKNISRVKISYNSPYQSWLEGIVARGDERVGELIIRAFKKGARFDAWDDLFDKEAWEDSLKHTDEMIRDIMMNKKPGIEFPWSSISLMVSKAFLRRELSASKSCALTDKCSHLCLRPCGACSDGIFVEDTRSIESRINILLKSEEKAIPGDDGKFFDLRVLFNYSKTNRAAYIPHHDIHTMLCRAFELSDIKIALSQGFNPIPRLEISEPLSLGFESIDEYGLAKIIYQEKYDLMENYKSKINSLLHSDLRIQYISIFNAVDGLKVPSLSSSHWGSVFRLCFENSHLDSTQFIEVFPGITLKNQKLSGAEAISNSSVTIDVSLPFTGNKEFGLSSLFQAIYGVSIRESYVSVIRIHQYAKNPDGKQMEYREHYKAYNADR